MIDSMKEENPWFNVSEILEHNEGNQLSIDSTISWINKSNDFDVQIDIHIPEINVTHCLENIWLWCSDINTCSGKFRWNSVQTR